MASPRAKYSNSASRVTKATARATIAVEPHNTRPTTTGISTAAVATRFHVIEEESPEKEQLHLIISSGINHAAGEKGARRSDQRRRINDSPRALASREQLRLHGCRRSGARVSEIRARPPAIARG